MAGVEKTTREVDKVRSYLEGVAKNLVDRLYGPEGLPWGTKLTELEDVVVAVRQVLSEKMLQQALERQAAAVARRPAAYQACPGCRGEVRQEPGPKPRRVQTRGGMAVWPEPETFCPQCRKAFFPSEPEPGDGSRRL
jgi:hypothetical protein